jgi:hypothetical protein
VYSSGTTGVPKCIVHSVGGVLISVTKEGLHKEMGPDSVMMQYTTVSQNYCVVVLWPTNRHRPDGSCTSSPCNAASSAPAQSSTTAHPSNPPQKSFSPSSRSRKSPTSVHHLASSTNSKSATSFPASFSTSLHSAQYAPQAWFSQKPNSNGFTAIPASHQPSTYATSPAALI